MIKPACYGFDLDGTLAYFKNSKKGLFNIFTTRGISQNIIQQAYEESKKNDGFSIKNIIDRLNKNGIKIKNQNEIIFEFNQWLKKSLALYPDARFLTNPQKINCPIAIITRGNPEYQKQKIKMLGIHHDNFYAGNTPQIKSDAIKKLIRLYGKPIVYIDDNIKEINEIRAAGLNEKDVITILVSRSPLPTPDK